MSIQRINEDTDDRLYVDYSTIPNVGKGVFAKRPIGIGEIIEIQGIVFKSGGILDKCSASYDGSKLRIGEDIIMLLGYSAMIKKHPYNANIKLHKEDKISFIVTQDIGVGEELLAQCHIKSTSTDHFIRNNDDTAYLSSHLRDFIWL